MKERLAPIFRLGKKKAKRKGSQKIASLSKDQHHTTKIYNERSIKERGKGKGKA